MKTLNDLVKDTVSEFIANKVLFTAIDVSNKVKESLPFTRHNEVRDLVRDMYCSDIQSSGYMRTTIDVTLKDDSKVKAMLYHHMNDFWDIDSKYPQQNRTAHLNATQVSPQTPVVQQPAQMPVAQCVTQPVAQASVQQAVQQLPARDLWNQLFSSKPSLFPRR